MSLVAIVNDRSTNNMLFIQALVLMCAVTYAGSHTSTTVREPEQHERQGLLSAPCATVAVPLTNAVQVSKRYEVEHHSLTEGFNCKFVL